MMENNIQQQMRPIPSIQDIAKIINATSNARDRAIILTLSKTGIKVNELINLNVDNVSWEKRSIRVPMVMRDEQREVFFDDECEAALKLLLTERVSDKENALFTDSRGERLTYKSIGTVVKNAVNKSGIPESMTPSDFRRAFLTTLVINGCSCTIVDILLGHALNQMIHEMVFLPTKEHVRQEYLKAMPIFGV